MKADMHAHRFRLMFVPALCALSIGVGVAGMAWGLQARREAAIVLAARPEPRPEPLPRPAPPREVDVASLVRALRLITVEIDTTVRSEVVHESWRGDVSAAVDTPVRYFYGTDLAGLEEGSVRRGLLTGEVEVRIPPPRRLAVEVISGDERTSVDVGWARLRDRAGEFYLGQARAAMHKRAREAPLRPADAARVERLTTEQVASLIRAVLGESAPVRVVIDEHLRGDGAPIVDAGGDGR